MTEPKPNDANDRLRRLAKTRGRRAEQRAALVARLAGTTTNPRAVKLRPLGDKK